MKETEIQCNLVIPKKYIDSKKWIGSKGDGYKNDK